MKMIDFKNFKKNRGTEELFVEKILKRMGKELPKDYKDFIKETNGGIGEINDSYIELWSIEDIENNNINYAVEEFLPGVILIGSNGSGDAYGIDMRRGRNDYIKVPFMDMDFDEMDVCGRTIEEFFNNL